MPQALASQDPDALRRFRALDMWDSHFSQLCSDYRALQRQLHSVRMTPGLRDPHLSRGIRDELDLLERKIRARLNGSEL